MNKIFFYGLFMDRTLLEEKGLHPFVIGPGVLSGYRIQIGERASLVPSLSRRVWGLVIELPEEEVRALYADPGVREYVRERVRVELAESGKLVEADCYILPRERALTGANPAYAEKLSRLVGELGFDPAYAREIVAFGEGS